MGKNTLPPQVEEKLRAYEARRKVVSITIKTLEDSIDQVIADLEAHDGDEWEDPSVVRDAEGVNRAAASGRP